MEVGDEPKRPPLAQQKLWLPGRIHEFVEHDSFQKSVPWSVLKSVLWSEQSLFFQPFYRDCRFL